MFGSSGTVTSESWSILHATAADLYGPWVELAPIILAVCGSGVAAPGVIFEDGVFHMFIQTEFMKSGGRCEHATAERDCGIGCAVAPQRRKGAAWRALDRRCE